MFFKKIIGAALFVSFSMPQLALASDQIIELSYSERTDVGIDMKQFLAVSEEKANASAEKKCNGEVVKQEEKQSYYRGPWNYSLVTVSFKFSCNFFENVD